MSIWTVLFWKAATERAFKTGAQVLGALILAAGASAGFDDIDWGQTASTTGLAILLSLVTSVGSGLLTDGSPSLTDVEVLAKPGTVEPIEDDE